MPELITDNYLIVVPADAPREVWADARAEGVTASEVHAITQGGRSTWQRILEDKLNGAKFKGNAQTRRGHEREGFLLAYADRYIASLRPNLALLGATHAPLHRATPDAIGWAEDRGYFGAEVKSHDHGWTRTDIPAEHYDQMQFGMWVTGFRWWLYVWEVMGEDGTPTLDDPEYVWVERDDARIAVLAAEADRFIEWRAAGAPAVDGDLPADVDDALAQWRAARERKTAAEVEEKAATARIREYAEQGRAKGAGSRAHFTYAVTTTQELDLEAWAAAEPDTFAEREDMRERLAALDAAALALYSKPKTTTRLNIYANKEKP